MLSVPSLRFVMLKTGSFYDELVAGPVAVIADGQMPFTAYFMCNILPVCIK